MRCSVSSSRCCSARRQEQLARVRPKGRGRLLLRNRCLIKVSARVDDGYDFDADEEDDDFFDEYGTELVESTQDDADDISEAATRTLSKEELRMQLAEPDGGGVPVAAIAAALGAALVAVGLFLKSKQGTKEPKANDGDQVRYQWDVITVYFCPTLLAACGLNLCVPVCIIRSRYLAHVPQT
jgi:hypothetical protein